VGVAAETSSGVAVETSVEVSSKASVGTTLEVSVGASLEAFEPLGLSVGAARAAPGMSAMARTVDRANSSALLMDFLLIVEVFILDSFGNFPALLSFPVASACMTSAYEPPYI
jgi:hypothetical protein